MPEILIYGEIGSEVKATKIADQLSKIDGDVTVRVNSPGGDVYEGIALMNSLRAHPGYVTVIIDGLAASAASFIAVGGGDRVVARPHAELMIHSAWTGAQGNAGDLTDLVSSLTRIDANLADIYATKAGVEPSAMSELMQAETWFSAQEALEVGLIDAVEDARAPQAEVKQPIFAKALNRFKYAGREEAPAPEIKTRVADPPREENMSIFDKLAEAAGTTPDELRKELSGIFNEVVPINGEVEVSYPADVKIVPTEKIKVEPVIGDKPAEPAEGEPVEDPAAVVAEEPAGDSAAVQLAKSAGLKFEMGDIAEGFTAEVDEGGIVTIIAPSGAEVGSTAEFTVMVNEAAVPLTVTVRSLSEEDAQEDEGGSEPDQSQPAATEGNAPAEGAEIPRGYALVPEAHLQDLTARAALGDEAFNAKAQADVEAEVDKWIDEGRFSASHREAVLASMRDNSALTRKTWGALPANSIPRTEVGYGRDPEADSEPSKAEDLVKLAKSRMGIK